MRQRPMKIVRAPRALAAGGVVAAAGLVLALQAVTTPAASQDAGAVKVDAGHCASLKGQTLGGAVIESGEVVNKGDTLIKLPFGEVKALASYCKVSARTSSGPGSSIRLGIFLPPAWNGKLVGVGGGGLSGGLGTAPLMLGPLMAQGYAGVATDAGHVDAPNAAWAINAPARIKDFGFNANHLGLVAAKATVGAYYGRPAERAYFHGCSNGGRDALILAQRFPNDYDGIVVGAPAADYTDTVTSFLRYNLLFKHTAGAEALPKKLPLVRAAIVRKCDKLDGVADGVLENPLACKFDPAELQCKPGQDTAQCLTKPEIAVARDAYRGAVGRNGKQIYPGYPLTSEYNGGETVPSGWAVWFLGPPNTGTALAHDFFRGLVKQDANWDPETFDTDRDFAEARAKVGPDLNALDANLTPFLQHGGKLLMYHGWEDPAIPATISIDYYKAVRKRTGKAAENGVRLFMAPGMAHCGQGLGANVVQPVADLDRWIASGKAPDQILATRPENGLAAFLGQPTKTVRSRPLCAYPMVARYNGVGSTDEAANFSCKAPKGAKG